LFLCKGLVQVIYVTCKGYDVWLLFHSISGPILRILIKSSIRDGVR
jgi:hypothetical protein